MGCNNFAPLAVACFCSQGPQCVPVLYQSFTKDTPSTESAVLLHEPQTAVQMLSSPSNLQNSPNINKPKAKINPKSWHTRYPRSCKIEVVEINQKSSPATIAGLFFCHCRCLRRSSPKGGFKAICQIFSRSWIKSRRIMIGIAEFCTIIDASFPLSSS